MNDSRRLFSRITAAPRTTTCWTPSTECLSIQTIVRVNSVVTSLAASRDGRVFFIEDGQWVGVISSDVLQAHAVVIAGAGVRLGQIVLDPMFHLSGLTYVSEIEPADDGTCELRIVRYRVADNQAGEREELVTIPRPSCSGEADFTVTSDEQSGSPTFATGSAPPAIAIADLTQRLRLAGVDFGTGVIHSVAAGLSGDLYLAVQTPSAAGFTTSILRLTPTQSR